MKNTQITSEKLTETKLVVITRKDISPGYVVVQSSHSIADFADTHKEHFKDWKEQSNSIICLSIPDETELLKLYNKFKDKTPSIKFFEPDVDAYTSICLYGTEKIRKSLSHLPLSLKELLS